jgi:hypothetical protein
MHHSNARAVAPERRECLRVEGTRRVHHDGTLWHDARIEHALREGPHVAIPHGKHHDVCVNRARQALARRAKRGPDAVRSPGAGERGPHLPRSKDEDP